jgi:hypothetical protein
VPLEFNHNVHEDDQDITEIDENKELKMKSPKKLRVCSRRKNFHLSADINVHTKKDVFIDKVTMVIMKRLKNQ